MTERKDYDLEKIYKLSQFSHRDVRGPYQIPVITVTKQIPIALINFKDAMRSNVFNKFVHFYLNDGEFECVWRNPERYMNRMKLFAGILIPDYSLYTDMPIAVQVWNVYRSRVLGRMFHKSGCKIIPSISWSDSRSYSFAFDGIPRHSVVSVSSVGIWREKSAQRLFLKGLTAMIEKIVPSCIVFYGKIPVYDFGDIPVKQYIPDTFLWKKNLSGVYYKER